MNDRSVKAPQSRESGNQKDLGTAQNVPAYERDPHGEQTGVIRPVPTESLLGESFSQLAAGIEADHAAALRAANTTLEHARCAGQRLLEVKSRIPHGEFEIWIEQHVSISYRTCRRYMRVAKEWHQMEAKMATRGHFGLREAERLVSRKGGAAPESTTKVESEPRLQPKEEPSPDTAVEPLLAAIKTLTPGQGLVIDSEVEWNGEVLDDYVHYAVVGFLGPDRGYQIAAIKSSYDAESDGIFWLLKPSPSDAFTMLCFMGFRREEFELVDDVQPFLDEHYQCWKKADDAMSPEEAARRKILRELSDIRRRRDAKTPADVARVKTLEDQLRQLNQQCCRDGV